jgi:beta-galactosidase/beta-glucuronidase
MPPAMLAALFVAFLTAHSVCYAETYVPEASNRVTINFGATPWKFYRGDIANAQNPTFSDAAWKTIGLPHTWNDTDTYLNTAAGGPDPNMGGMGWYRKHFTLDYKYSGRKIFVEFEASHVGIQVYINGTMIKGNSAVNLNATHVVGFLPIIVDITPYVTFGATENVIACRVSGSEGFYTFPTFSIDFRFGQGDYGLWRPAWMHITDKVYIPANVYSVVNNWGTYVSTMTATDASATVKILTHVKNENAAPANVTLTTKIVEAASKTVVWSEDKTQPILADSAVIFDQTATVANPKLWYPANSVWGKPNMYRVYHIVRVGGNTVDVFESPLGIRVITWDRDFPIINGHPHYLWGGAARYDYPALGTAVPEDQQWRDVKLCAEAGGNLWRPGHSTDSPERTAACDAYGVMLIQPSGELEGNFATAQITPYKISLKTECHRDMIVRDRNNPSILAWEVSNGPIDPAFESDLKKLDSLWDPVHTRAMSDRGFGQAATNNIADIWSCSATGCETQFHLSNPTHPAWGAEAWGGSRDYRFNYDGELTFANEYVQNWKKSKNAKCFGLVHWYLMDTPGETGLGRSFASSMMDFSRIPKMLYYIYQACWTPFAVKPVVKIAHHWNRAGSITVNAFSNCQSVRLRINNNDQGTRVPYADSGTGTTLMPKQCQWNVSWQTGTVRAEGLDASGNVVCSDEIKTAGNPDHILLTVEPPIVRPDNGETFKIYNNGTDAAFILATVVDAAGTWCPTASNNITFKVSGPGNYRGGADNTISAGGLWYHAPGDPELTAEGGKCKVAVRSTFTTGTVTVNATSSGLGSGTASFTVYPVADPTSVQRPVVPDAQTLAQAIQVRAVGNTLRYYVGNLSSVSIEILNANGKVLNRVAESGQGWHSIRLTATTTKGYNSGNGIYFVRCAVDGAHAYQSAKRFLVVR